MFNRLKLYVKLKKHLNFINISLYSDIYCAFKTVISYSGLFGSQAIITSNKMLILFNYNVLIFDNNFFKIRLSIISMKASSQNKIYKKYLGIFRSLMKNLKIYDHLIYYRLKTLKSIFTYSFKKKFIKKNYLKFFKTFV